MACAGPVQRRWVQWSPAALDDQRQAASASLKDIGWEVGAGSLPFATVSLPPRRFSQQRGGRVAAVEHRSSGSAACIPQGGDTPSGGHTPS